MSAVKSQESKTCVVGGGKKLLNCYTQNKSQTQEERLTYKIQTYQAILLLRPPKICHCLNIAQNVYNYHVIVTRKIDGAQITHTYHIFSKGN